MCVEFYGLNKIYPKDCYPLPRINQLVDSMAGHQLISMMDAYQRYHQIPLVKEDQDKISFIRQKALSIMLCHLVSRILESPTKGI